MRIALTLAAVVVVLYALIDCILTVGPDARVLPKWLWLVVILVVPVLGAVAWFVGGRPAASDGRGLPGVGRRRGPAAPDDDPAFLRKLADDEWTRKMRERREGEHPDLP